MHKFDLARTIVPAAKMIIEKAPVLCGLAVTENATGGTHSLKLAKPEEFPDVDQEFLKLAWKLLPRLPIDDLDVLLVDEMGKNVSGAGMDPNIIGFWRREGGDRRPDYRTLIVLDLTPHSHGNAIGIGMAGLFRIVCAYTTSLQLPSASRSIGSAAARISSRTFSAFFTSSSES